MAAEVAELLRQAQAADDEEDRRYGKDKRGDELSGELAFREGRLEKIREAMAALEAEAQAAAEQAEAEGGKHPGVPDDKAQRNFSSGLRSPYSAPILDDTSASMIPSTSTLSASRRKSTSPSIPHLRNSSSRSILSLTTVVLLSRAFFFARYG